MDKTHEISVVRHQLEATKGQISRLQDAGNVPHEVSAVLLHLHAAIVALSNLVIDEKPPTERPRFGKPVL